MLLLLLRRSELSSLAVLWGLAVVESGAVDRFPTASLERRLLWRLL